ncbi:MAG: SCO family protein [Verrucomicrobia bacterium]|nr:SCO family protein [Verrucomicrobiota bacterium]
MKTVALFLLCSTAFALAPDAPADPSRRQTVTAKPDTCCCAPPIPTAAYSAKSLYQAEGSFTDDAGRVFRLGELRGRPVVLTMFFASCGYACPLLVADMQAIRAKLPPAIRGRAAFVLVSFDLARDTPPALAAYREQHGLGRDWMLLHGTDDSVRELAALLGVSYKPETGGGFSHSNLITILNREGEIIHQRAGLRGGLDETVAALTLANRE